MRDAGHGPLLYSITDATQGRIREAARSNGAPGATYLMTESGSPYLHTSGDMATGYMRK